MTYGYCDRTAGEYYVRTVKSLRSRHAGGKQLPDRTGIRHEPHPAHRKHTAQSLAGVCRRASFTVEAALLMTLILPALLALIYLGLYLHERGVLAGAAQESAAYADLCRWRSGADSRVRKKALKLAKSAGSEKKISASVSISKNKVSVSFSADMSLPGLLPRLFGRSVMNAGASASRSLPEPSDTIRKIRGLEYVSRMLTGSG